MELKYKQSISVLIPTKNGGGTIEEVLSMLSIQTIDISEILIADSGSKDKTVEIAKKYGAEVISIAPVEFDHGGTRTIMCQKAKGDLLVFLTQDAIPKTRDSLEKLIKPLVDNISVASSYGRQVPAFNADHFAEGLRFFNYSKNSRLYSFNDKKRSGLKAVFTSNSFACYRKKALAEVGYFKDGLIFGEDTVAVGRLLLKNYKNAYVADALVYHSHNSSAVDDFKRYFDIGVLHTKEKWLLETYGNATGRGKKYFQHELGRIRTKKRYSLLPELLIRLSMKYCGYRIGRYYTRLPMKIILNCSLHTHWWQKQINDTH